MYKCDPEAAGKAETKEGNPFMFSNISLSVNKISC